MQIRKCADSEGKKAHATEYDNAAVTREEVINKWCEEHPDTTLANDGPSRYLSWPDDLKEELKQIDQAAIRRGRQKYIALLEAADKQIQMLVSFYKDCGLINGRGSPPLSYWEIPKLRFKRSATPQYIQDKLDAIKKEYDSFEDLSEKQRTIGTALWLEASIYGESEPTGSDTPLPPSLLERLESV